MTYHDFVMNNLEMLLIFSVITGGLAAFVAKRKGKDPLFWFFIGALFGMLGVFVAFFFPASEKKKKLAFAGAQLSPEPVSAPSLSSALQHEWYYLEKGETQIGPLSFFELQQAWHNKTIDGTTLTWNKSLSDWTSIDQLPEIQAAIDPK